MRALLVEDGEALGGDLETQSDLEDREVPATWCPCLMQWGKVLKNPGSKIMGKYVLKSDGIRWRKSASRDVEKTEFLAALAAIYLYG